MASIDTIPLTRNDGATASLADYRGSVLLIVNVASKCGLTPQYDALEALYRAKHAEGLEILGFPANNFNGQEPGTDAEIATFCSTTFDVTFPIFSKIDVTGPGIHPLYSALTVAVPQATGDGPMRKNLEGYGIEVNAAPDVLWNFEKFVVDRSGAVIARFAPDVAPDDPRLIAAIDKALTHGDS